MAPTAGNTFLMYMNYVYPVKSIFIFPVKTFDIQAVEGRIAELPCDVTSVDHDKVHMVFWFRDDAGIPLYR